MCSERIEEQCGQRGLPAIAVADRVLLLEDAEMGARSASRSRPFSGQVWDANFADGRAGGPINVAADFGPRPQGERILRALARYVVRMRPKLIR